MANLCCFNSQEKIAKRWKFWISRVRVIVRVIAVFSNTLFSLFPLFSFLDFMQEHGVWGRVVKRATYNQTKDDASSSTREQSIPKIQVVKPSSINEQKWQTCSCKSICITCILVSGKGMKTWSVKKKKKKQRSLYSTWWMGGTCIDHESNGSSKGSTSS